MSIPYSVIVIVLVSPLLPVAVVAGFATSDRQPQTTFMLTGHSFHAQQAIDYGNPPRRNWMARSGWLRNRIYRDQGGGRNEPKEGR